jgi:hypothetical protein
MVFKKNEKMKKIILALIISTSLVSCWSDDDSYYDNRTINLNVKNLIEIENQTNFLVDEYVFFNVNFSRFLPENGFSDLLDIQRTSKSNKFNVFINFYKKDAYGNWIFTNFNNFYQLDKGEIITSEFGNNAFSVLNTSTNQYEFRAGIKLLEQGEYRLVIDPNVYSFNQNFNSYNSNNISVNLFHTFDSSTQNELIFTVN